MTARSCIACGKSPSGLIPRAHEFCEFCGAPLSSEVASFTCYRCGKRFEGTGQTICAECQQLPPTSTSTAESPESPRIFWAAFWGAALPLSVRITYSLLGGGGPSRESKAVTGFIAFVGASLVLGIVGTITGHSHARPRIQEHVITWLAGGLMGLLLWQFS